MQSSLVEDVFKAAGKGHCEPISWEAAVAKSADTLNALDSSNEAMFYTSGRQRDPFAYLLARRCQALLGQFLHARGPNAGRVEEKWSCLYGGPAICLPCRRPT